jgi:CPA2 family monovalent cation:H+ antiporter-2
VTIGALIDPRSLLANPSLLLSILAMVIFGKLVIWTAVVRLFRYPVWTAILVGIGLTQIGEFSYVLVQIARDARLVGQEVYSAILAASLLSILTNAILVRSVSSRIAGRK